MKKEALLYDKIDGTVNCKVCARKCVIPEKKFGFCGTRENSDGTLYTLIYAEASSMAVDPIEKKPLFHFYPGTTVFSMGTVGCNFRCKHCQNWTISQATLDEIPTEKVIPEKAIKLTKDYGCKSIAWTYNEPTIWLEYTYECAKLAKKDDIKAVYVTNGYMSEESFEMMKPYLDAANIDLKAFSDEFYREISSARLQPVLDTIKRMYENKIHIEVTNLIIPTCNDSEEDIRALVKFMVDELGEEVPLHFTRFFPYYKMSHLPSTPLKTLEKARDIAKEAGMRYVYVGNVLSHPGENTYCYNCGELLIKRMGFEILQMNLKNRRKCPNCNSKIDILI